MLRLPLTLTSPAGPRGRLSILIFHRVLPEPDPLCPDAPDASQFEAQMRWVRSWFNVLPLARAVGMLYDGTIAARSLAVTFDDGYADNEEIAAPILHRLGLPATFFVSTGFLEGDTMWNDRVIEAVRGCTAPALDLRDHGLGRYDMASVHTRRQAVGALLGEIKRLEPERRRTLTDTIVRATGNRASPALMMRPQQVRGLRARGMDVGAHTVSHPILARLSLSDARAEIATSKHTLEALLDERVDLFAYPNGVPLQDYRAEHAALVRESGFVAAVSTAWGAASMQSDPFQLPRFTPWDRSRLRYGARLLGNLRRVEETAR
jgi:peptidoglycan/xylan/chitin deacetylase (PgdA/CDA1 family)